MIKAMATDGTGKKILVLGLSFADLDKFRAEAGTTCIRMIIGNDLDLPLDLMLFCGETEAHLAELLAGGIGPDTKVHVSPRSKS